MESLLNAQGVYNLLLDDFSKTNKSTAGAVILNEEHWDIPETDLTAQMYT